MHVSENHGGNLFEGSGGTPAGSSPSGDQGIKPSDQITSDFREVTLDPKYLGQKALDIRVPPTLESFAEHYGASGLNPNSSQLFEDPACLDCATLFIESSTPILLQGAVVDTKNPIPFLALAPMLSHKESALLLFADNMKVKEAASAARANYYAGVVEVIELNGEIPVERRVEIYKELDGSSNKGKLIISNPDLILKDLKDGYLTLASFKAIVFNDIHLARGNHAYTELALHTANNPDQKKLFLSPCAARNHQERERLMTRLGADHFVQIRSEKSDLAESVELVELSGKMARARDLLEQGIGTVFREIEQALQAEASTAAQSQAALLKQLRKTYTKNGEPIVPPAGAVTGFQSSFGRFFRQLHQSEQAHFGEALSKVAELGHIAYLHSALTYHGQFAFLDFAGRALAEVRFNNGPKNFRERIYNERTEVLEAFSEIASGIPYELLLNSGSWREIQSNAAGFKPSELRSIEDQFFDRYAFDHLVKRDEADHPKEEQLHAWITGDPELVGAAGVLVRVDEAGVARLREARLKQHLKVDASWVAGKKYLDQAERSKRLDRFSQGEGRRVLIFTRAEVLGSKVKGCDTVIIESPPTEPAEMLALQQIVASKERSDASGGVAVSILTTDPRPGRFSQDELRHATLLEKIRKNQKDEENLFTIS